MKLSRPVCAVIFAVVLNALTVAAFAASGATLLGFGADYTAPDGSNCVHRGADVSASAGSAFGAPVGGTVKFAGRVPGPHGGSILAVTLETASGTVSMLPFERLDVSKGDSVAAGEAVGRVANDGDPSSSESHVHVSLRHGDLYVDPSGLLGAPTTLPEQEPEPQVSTVPSPGPISAPSPYAAQPSPAPAPQLAQGVTLAPSGASVAEVPAVTISQLSTAATPQTKSLATNQVAPESGLAAAPDTGVTVVSAAPKVSPLTGSAARDSIAPPATLLSSSAASALTALRSISGAAAPAAAALGFALAASLYLLGRRSLERRMTADSPVSGRLGTLLQQLRAGDTLRGLTSCSGHAAFTVPEPFSPREVTK